MQVKCRQVIQPSENVQDIIKQLNDINLGVIDRDEKGKTSQFLDMNSSKMKDLGVNKILQFVKELYVKIKWPPCLLDIQQDLPSKRTPQPLYIIPDTNQFWLPNARGQLQVPRGDVIELYCSKSFANATEENNSTAVINNATSSLKFTNKLKVAKNTKTLRPRCLHNKTFIWQNEKYDLQQFICEQSPKYTVEQLHDKCTTMIDDRASLNAQMYRVGFNISGNRFLETMRICFDDMVLRTLYVQHKLLPASIHFQKFIKRLNFSKAGHFKDVNMNYLYSQQSQRQRAADLLKGQHKHLFDKSTLFWPVAIWLQSRLYLW
ncbi:hypothetical protein EVAR_73578_1 [Eumeta japonica]|uniref:Uncharacterized protein n=1 Tax=Eumeta variegata TaxID=151549 RepID=A0A4C1TM03_EUMVA|nr:hypothetical protein EVAR_73578_1 [Eumeta japonica]